MSDLGNDAPGVPGSGALPASPPYPDPATAGHPAFDVPGHSGPRIGRAGVIVASVTGLLSVLLASGMALARYVTAGMTSWLDQTWSATAQLLLAVIGLAAAIAVVAQRAGRRTAPVSLLAVAAVSFGWAVMTSLYFYSDGWG